MSHYDIEQGKARRQQAAAATEFVHQYLLEHSWSNQPNRLHHVASGAVGSYLRIGMVQTKHLVGTSDEYKALVRQAIAAAADEGLLPSHA